MSTMAHMADEVRQRVEDLCGKIEQAFPGVFCAYSGFAQPRLPTEDGDLVVEVFFAPPGASRAVTRASVEHTRRLRQDLGVSVAVVVHYVEDTIKYYLGDVEAIAMVRDVARDRMRDIHNRMPHVLDPVAFLSASVHQAAKPAATVLGVSTFTWAAGPTYETISSCTGAELLVA